MTTNQSFVISAPGRTKFVALLLPLLGYAGGIYAQSLPIPTVQKAAPAVKAPATAPARPATQAPGTGRTTNAPAVRGGLATPAGAAKPTTPAAAPRRATPGIPAGQRPAASGGRAGVAPTTKEINLPGGGAARFDRQGRITDLHKGLMNIHRSPDGVRTVRVKREADRVIVARGRDGYVQDRYVYRGREFIHRTYYVHGRAYDRFYNRYLYRGVYLEGYAPVLYYPSFYYGWAYAPWPAPVPYAWVWIGNPWAVYYGPYFTPFTLYPSPAFWLTDYLISASLAAEYQAQLDAANGAVPQAFAAAPAPIAPEVQQAIAIEVQRQIALENSEAQQLAQNAPPDPASGGLVRMLTDNTSHIFVAGTGLAVSDANGPCDLSPGDVLQLSPPNPSLSADTSAATLVVLASKPQECPRGDAVSVQLTDLQDMQNYMRETMDQGLADLRATAGKGGLPAIPQAAKGPAAPAPFAVAATPPDPNAASEIAQQVQAADQAEREAAGYGQAQLAAGHAPPLIPEQGPLKNGMTIDQVEAELGKPARSFEAANHGMIYIYKNPTMKITFKDGKAVDVQ